MTVPLNRPCPQCGAEMELLASDESGAVLVYECVDCGYQSEERVENVLEPASEDDEVVFQPEDEEEFPEEEEDELDESLWEEDEEEEDAWR
jgi:uncharacterized metal-binding protein (TIGR02443 family)